MTDGMRIAHRNPMTDCLYLTWMSRHVIISSRSRCLRSRCRALRITASKWRHECRQSAVIRRPGARMRHGFFSRSAGQGPPEVDASPWIGDASEHREYHLLGEFAAEDLVADRFESRAVVVPESGVRAIE